MMTMKPVSCHRRLVSDPEAGRRIGAKARASIAAKYDNQVVGRLIANRIKKIGILRAQGGKQAAGKSGLPIPPRRKRSVNPSLDPEASHELHVCAGMPKREVKRCSKAALPANMSSMLPMRLAMIATYPPRACGIGTFTRMLIQVRDGGDLKV